ncbi:MAG: hypothetical protein ACYC9Z_18635 [Casimicrobiaceae bacterium]
MKDPTVKETIDGTIDAAKASVRHIGNLRLSSIAIGVAWLLVGLLAVLLAIGLVFGMSTVRKQEAECRVYETKPRTTTCTPNMACSGLDKMVEDVCVIQLDKEWGGRMWGMTPLDRCTEDTERRQFVLDQMCERHLIDLVHR